MQAHARVVIIGGGMIGVGLAYHLAEAGRTEFLLIQKGERRRLTLLAEPAWDPLNERERARHPSGD